GLATGRRRCTAPPVTSSAEHSTLLRWLRSAPTPPTEVPVDPGGAVALPSWAGALGEETPFAVLQSANHEVGTRQPLPAARDAAAGTGDTLLVDTRDGLGRRDRLADALVLIRYRLTQ